MNHANTVIFRTKMIIVDIWRQRDSGSGPCPFLITLLHGYIDIQYSKSDKLTFHATRNLGKTINFIIDKGFEVLTVKTDVLDASVESKISPIKILPQRQKLWAVGNKAFQMMKNEPLATQIWGKLSEKWAKRTKFLTFFSRDLTREMTAILD